MQTALLLILIIIANLVLYWVFYGKQKFEDKLKEAEKKEIKKDGKTLNN
jgi:hypothetical protein